jgi:MoaA/NifB/PqqE/SkfB family radical SAM enzyme
VHCIFSKENNLGNYPYEDLPFELFKKVLPVFSKDKPIVELYGHGETLTHKQFFDMMDALLDAGCSVEFLTNGQLLDDEKIEKIVSRGVSKVGFSIDGATPEMYEKIRRGASFEKLINNIRKIDEFKKRLGKNTPLISIGFVAMRQNIHELPELIRLAHSLGAFLVHVMELAEYNLTRGESLANQQVLADWVEKAEIEAKRLNIQLALPTHIPGRDAPPANLTTPQNSAPHKIIKSCRMPWEYVFIRTSGAIQPCCFIPDIYGQLKDEEFTEIWHGSKFLQLRDGLLEGAPPEPCTRCPYYV